MKLILRSCRNVSVDSSVFPTFFTLAQQCHLHHNKATKRRSPRRHHTGPNFTQARVDGTPHLLEDKLLRLFPAPPRTYPAPLTCVARFPILFPPLGHTRTHAAPSAVCASVALFSCLGSSRAHPASPANRKRRSALTWITTATAARAAKPGPPGGPTRSSLFSVYQRHRDKTFILKKFTLRVD